MDQNVPSMATRSEVTKQLRADYRTGTKAEKRLFLTSLVPRLGLAVLQYGYISAPRRSGLKMWCRSIGANMDPRSTRRVLNSSRSGDGGWVGVASGGYMDAALHDWLD